MYMYMYMQSNIYSRNPLLRARVPKARVVTCGKLKSLVGRAFGDWLEFAGGLSWALYQVIACSSCSISLNHQTYALSSLLRPSNLMYELGQRPDECVDAVSGRHGPNPDLLVLAGFVSLDSHGIEAQSPTGFPGG